MGVDKSALSEADICTQFITPAILQAGWDLSTQIRQEVTFTDGQILVRGKVVKRGEKKRADYIISHRPNLRLAVIEAKDNNHSLGAGIQQALAYAGPDALDLPFVFSSNGDGFLFHDKTVTDGPIEQELSLDQFPTPAVLWDRYCAWKGLATESRDLVEQEYYSDGSGKEPRYYHSIAINRVVEAVAKGQNRVLLVMATGTGKTYTAFQIIWRLWKSGRRKRMLFLADRNILVDRTKTNDFKPFGGVMFDLHLISVDATSMKVLDSSSLSGTIYQKYAGKKINIPHEETCRPNVKALEKHQKKFRK